MDHFLDDEAHRAAGNQQRRIDGHAGSDLVHPEIAGGQKPALRGDHAVNGREVDMNNLSIDAHLHRSRVRSMTLFVVERTWL